jgi:hypothetical protein
MAGWRRLGAPLAVAVISLAIASAPAPASSSKWSTAKCTSAYKHWLHSHKGASTKQIGAELGALERAHDCVFGAK